MEFLGLEVEEEESHRHVLIQPCRGLKKRCCSIYAHRPESCRTFVCLALEQVRQNELSLEEALRIVQKIRCHHRLVLAGEMSPRHHNPERKERESLCAADAARGC